MNILYLNKNDIENTGELNFENLPRVWETVKTALIQLGEGKAQSPLDLFLRPGEEGCMDRAIAKAAYLNINQGCSIQKIAGVKWISSAPLNIDKGIPRASGIIILNDALTGQVMAILDAAPINALRTAAVSMIAFNHIQSGFRRFVIFGAGIIGTEHLRQILAGFSMGFFTDLKEIAIFDVNKNQALTLLKSFESIAEQKKITLNLAESLDDCFKNNSSVVIATNALTPYLNRELIEGRSGPLIVSHVSLRDFFPEALASFDDCIVDSWDHVNREGTSINLAYKKGLVLETDCIELIKILGDEKREYGNKVIINPMGLPVTDLAISWKIYWSAMEQGVGTLIKN